MIVELEHLRPTGMVAGFCNELFNGSTSLQMHAETPGLRRLRVRVAQVR
jgi:hypothetical protein